MYDDGEIIVPTPRASMRNWTRDKNECVHGEVYGHLKHPDGTRLHTTRKLRQYRHGNALMFQAWHTLYELTGPNGEEWFVHTGRAKPKQAQDSQDSEQRT